MASPFSRQSLKTNTLRSLVPENANDDEMCIILDSDDDSSGSETSAAYGYQVNHRVKSAVSQKITLYEDLSCRDESEGDFSSPRRSFSKGHAVSRTIRDAAQELQASADAAEIASPTKSTTKEFLVSPVKAIERAKRTKIWEKASLYEKSSKTQEQPLLSSPRRKALPEALQPVLKIFEGRRMYQKDDSQMASVRDLKRGPKNNDEGGAFLELDDDDDDDDSDQYYDDSQYRHPVGSLKTTLQKFEKLSQLAKKKKDIENEIRTLERRVKRRGSAGNGTISGKTVDEKMMHIDEMFHLHHNIRGTEVDSLAAMRESVKEAHRDDFEKQVRVAKKKELLDRYETNMRMEKVQRKLKKAEELARQMMETSELIHKKVVQESVHKTNVSSGKMSRRQTIARSAHVVTDLPKHYTRADNSVILQLRHEYQRQSLGLDDYLDFNESCGSLPAVLDDDDHDNKAYSTSRNAHRYLRPGLQRGDSYGNELNDSEDELSLDVGNTHETDHPRKSRSYRSSGLRPGMQRGDSFGDGIKDRDHVDMDDEEDNHPRKSRSYRSSGLRPGMQRGDSFGDGSKDQGHADMDDEEVNHPRKSRSYRSSGLRPGMQRGDSFGDGIKDRDHVDMDDEEDNHPRKSRSYRSSGLRPGMQRGDSFGDGSKDQDHVDMDDEEVNHPRKSRSYRSSGLRPGMQRGDSFGDGSKDRDHVDMDDEEDNHPRKSRSYRSSGLRPGMQRGDSFGDGSKDQDHVDMDDEDDNYPRKSRSYRSSGLRPGMQRGDSFGDGIKDRDHADMDDEEDNRPRKSRSYRSSGLRPGMQRGDSFDDGIKDRDHADMDDEDDNHPRKSRSYRSSGLRPGMQRGDSFGDGRKDQDHADMDDEEDNHPRKSRSNRSSGLRPGMQRGDSFGDGIKDRDHVDMDDEEDNHPRKSRSYRSSGLRPGMQRGDSFGDGSKDQDQHGADDMNDEDDKYSGKSRSYRSSGLRPGMQRGGSLGDGLADLGQHGAHEMDAEDDSQPHKSRSYRSSGMRPGMERGNSFGNGLSEHDNESDPIGQQVADDVAARYSSKASRTNTSGMSSLRPGMQRGSSFDDDVESAAEHVEEKVESPVVDTSDSFTASDRSLSTSMDLSHASFEGSIESAKVGLYASASEFSKTSLYGSAALSYCDSDSSEVSVSVSSSDDSSDSDANKRINALLNKTSKYLTEHGKQALVVRRVSITKSGDRDDKKKHKKDKKKKHDKDKKVVKDDDIKKRRDKRKEKKKTRDI